METDGAGSTLMRPPVPAKYRSDQYNHQSSATIVIAPAPRLSASMNAKAARLGSTGPVRYVIADSPPRVAKGKVLAEDIQPEMLDMLKARNEGRGIANIKTILGELWDPKLPPASCDLILLVDVYHELEYPVEMLLSIKSALRKDGRLLLIEYKGEDPDVHIRPLHKTTVSQLNKELGANGFKLVYDGEFLPLQHFLLYEKKD